MEMQQNQKNCKKLKKRKTAEKVWCSMLSSALIATD
jgi:hypothetical protein